MSDDASFLQNLPRYAAALRCRNRLQKEAKVGGSRKHLFLSRGRAVEVFGLVCRVRVKAAEGRRARPRLRAASRLSCFIPSEQRALLQVVVHAEEHEKSRAENRTRC